MTELKGLVSLELLEETVKEIKMGRTKLPVEDTAWLVLAEGIIQRTRAVNHQIENLEYAREELERAKRFLTEAREQEEALQIAFRPLHIARAQRKLKEEREREQK